METLVKYENRKLYSKTLSKYVTLEYIKDLVKSSQTFEVVSHKTKKDITNKTLKEVLSLVDIPHKTMVELVRASL